MSAAREKVENYPLVMVCCTIATPPDSKNANRGSVNILVAEPSEKEEELRISCRTSDAPTKSSSLDRRWIRIGMIEVSSLNAVSVDAYCEDELSTYSPLR